MVASGSGPRSAGEGPCRCRPKRRAPKCSGDPAGAESTLMSNRIATRPLRPSAVGEVGDGVVCDGGGRRGKPVAWFYTLGGYGVGRSIGQWTVPKKGSTHERRGPARGDRKSTRLNSSH